jgi:hypothetical protein
MGLNHLRAFAKGLDFIIGHDNPDFFPNTLQLQLQHLREMGLIELTTDTTIVACVKRKRW